MRFEASIIEYLQLGATEGWVIVFKIITLFGSWLGLAVFLAIIFFKKKSLSYAFLITFLTGPILNLGLKYIFKRPRPFDTYSTIINFAKETGYSFPSSHSICVAIIAVFIIYFVFITAKTKFPKVITTISMVLFALLIAFSRMFLGVHYLTDVLTGLVIGVLLGILGIALYRIIMQNLAKKKKKDKIENGKTE